MRRVLALTLLAVLALAVACREDGPSATAPRVSQTQLTAPPGDAAERAEVLARFLSERIRGDPP